VRSARLFQGIFRILTDKTLEQAAKVLQVPNAIAT
jgi:hypothetical protein